MGGWTLYAGSDFLSMEGKGAPAFGLGGGAYVASLAPLKGGSGAGSSSATAAGRDATGIDGLVTATLFFSLTGG